MLRIVTGTRHPEQDFWGQTLLGRTLKRLSTRGGVRESVSFGNTRGLPEVFNAALAAADDGDTIVFTHDDVWIEDCFLPERLDEALVRFAVVGVAGSRRRIPRQPGWAYLDAHFTPDIPENVSGAVYHVHGVLDEFAWFGTTPGTVKLLDGVFIATRVKTLRTAGVTFDPRFAFHFYDADFCRSCEKAGLEMGTWPITITHGSAGRFGTPEWFQAYQTYLQKWGD